VIAGLGPAGWARVLPMAVFMAVLGLRGVWEPAWVQAWWPTLDPRWLYALQAGAAGALLLWWGLARREYGELARANAPTLREAALAVAVGLGVFALWIHLDAPWMQLAPPSASFTPLRGDGTLDLGLLAARCIGAVLVVPVMEELFWRSFLMRWIQAPQFAGVPPQQVGLKAVVLSSFVFTLAHTLWLAAALAALAYAWLYIRSGKLWCAVIAHAVTNAALAAWVLHTGRWEFW
jgi:CAAX prenyl protease-like protein